MMHCVGLTLPGLMIRQNVQLNDIKAVEIVFLDDFIHDSLDQIKRTLPQQDINNVEQYVAEDNDIPTESDLALAEAWY